MRLLSRVALVAFLATPGAFALASGCGGTGGSSESSGTAAGGSGHGGSGHGGTDHGGAGHGGTGNGGTSNSSSGTGAGVSSSAGGAGTTSSGTGAGSSSGTVSTSSGGGPCVQATCQGKLYACGDCMDNDGDGLIDGDDPDCLGPCDNTEDSYFGGIPGQNNAPCKMDCYFDQDTGTGNDDCYWDHRCDPNAVAPNYYPEAQLGDMCEYNPDPNYSPPASSLTCSQMYNTQSATCKGYCGPLTPNGCDCFGCCELPAGGGKYVYLGSMDGDGNGTCDIAHVADPMKCQPCLPVKACLNTCEKCELCLGKTTLPPECYPPDGGTSSSSSSSSSSTSTSSSTGSSSSGISSSSSSSSSGGTGQCSDGVQPCGLSGQAPCGLGFYCITGCCQAVPK